jgi:hypothetical protein
MNFYTILVILFFILLIPVSFADAVKIPFIENSAEGGPAVYGFAQIIHRDSNGNLLALIQSDKMTDLDSYAMNYYMDQEERKGKLTTYDMGGQLVQVYSDKFTNPVQIPDLTASTLLVIKIPTKENPSVYDDYLGARFAHDGLLMSPGETMETTWYFARLL